MNTATTCTEHVLQTGKVTTYLNIRSRGYVRGGIAHEGTCREGHNVSVTPGVSVRLWGMTRADFRAANEVFEKYDRTFVIGDEVEYDSYNFSYTGKIVSIGAKTVTVETESGRRTRLDLCDFSRRNYDLDLEQIRARNHRTMMEC